MSKVLLHTKAALREYDAGEPARETLFADALAAKGDKHKRLWAKYEKAEKEAKESVHQAYYNDTKDINKLEDCRRVHLSTLRRWCSK